MTKKDVKDNQNSTRPDPQAGGAPGGAERGRPRDQNKLRRNRLALLQAISKVLLQIADYSQIVVEGENQPARK